MRTPPVVGVVAGAEVVSVVGVVVGVVGVVVGVVGVVVAGVGVGGKGVSETVVAAVVTAVVVAERVAVVFATVVAVAPAVAADVGAMVDSSAPPTFLVRLLRGFAKAASSCGVKKTLTDFSVIPYNRLRKLPKPKTTKSSSWYF
jgi:hypothetical protein